METKTPLRSDFVEIARFFGLALHVLDNAFRKIDPYVPRDQALFQFVPESFVKSLPPDYAFEAFFPFCKICKKRHY